MFFANRITNILPTDKVLEIGPGGTPHPRSDVFLEKVFADPDEASRQRGRVPELQTSKKVVFYEGDQFPFDDDEFDYLICSHVLEHVEDIEPFVQEMLRVAKKGYLEYPTIYYDFLYNFPEHKTLLMHKGGTIFWLPKSESGLNAFAAVNKLFYESLLKGYDTVVVELKEYFFQGFEWDRNLLTKKINDINSLCYQEIELIPRSERKTTFWSDITRALPKIKNCFFK